MDSFEDIATRYRPELRAHCYRMLGSLSEAEDAVQDALLKAWKGLPGFEGRASLRTWLYRIATHTCLDALDKRSARLSPMERWQAANPRAPLPDPLPASEFIDPYAAAPWGAAMIGESRATERESVALAFIAALERLPPLQRAVLLLRDVIELSAAETAALLDKTTQAVESALERARAATVRKTPATRAADPDLLRRYLAAWETKDPDALAGLLREDAMMTMPPLPTWLDGRAAIREFAAGLMAQLGPQRGRVIEIAGGTGVAFWVQPPGHPRFVAASVSAVTMGDGGIATVDTFLGAERFPRFGLPLELDA